MGPIALFFFMVALFLLFSPLIPGFKKRPEERAIEH
jgi:hypothetical protein